MWEKGVLCGTESFCMRHSSYMLDRTISCGAVNLIWDKSLSHMGESSLMWDRADSPTRFVTSFKIILKLVEFFTSGRNRKSYKKYLGHSERFKSFVTSFKIILKLVECFTSSRQPEKIFRTLTKVYKL